MTDHEEADRAQPSQSLSDFELGPRIGEGGSAEVFRARNRTFNVDVALKIWRRPLTDDERRKFYDECRLHWRLSEHPNIVRLYWAEAPAGGRAWLATELQEMSLDERLARGPLGRHEAWQLAQDILAGLAAIHREGHLHRDIKPANVLLKAGRAVLCDLGIAMRIGGWTKFRAAGTDHFIAPELLTGDEPTARADVYSAAVTIRRLFPRPLPPALSSLLQRAAGPEPQRRPRDAGAFLSDLSAIAQARNRGRRLGRRRSIAAAGVLGALAAGGIALALDRSGGSRDQPVAVPSSAAPTIAPSSRATSASALASAPPSVAPSRSGVASSSSAKATTGDGGVGRCGKRVAAGTPVAYSRKLISSPAGAAAMKTSGSTTTVTFDHQYTWAGLFLGLPKGVCNYRLSLEARIVEPSRTMTDGEGWGYGLGPCDLVNGGEPFGFSLQNALIQLNGAASGNSGTFRNPEVNDGKLLDIPADYNWHQWTLDVVGNTVTITREFGVAVTTAAVTGAAGLPETCDGTGVFLRAFNGSASFRKISITGI